MALNFRQGTAGRKVWAGWLDTGCGMIRTAGFFGHLTSGPSALLDREDMVL